MGGGAGFSLLALNPRTWKIPPVDNTHQPFILSPPEFPPLNKKFKLWPNKKATHKGHFRSPSSLGEEFAPPLPRQPLTAIW